MTGDRPVSIRMLGSLHTWRKSRGLPAEVTQFVPPEGRRADEIARDLGLPMEKIEAVFCNHIVYDLEHSVMPGDAIAFVPRGTPGPHRYFLGIHEAGKKQQAH